MSASIDGHIASFPELHNAERISVDVETYDPQLKELGPGPRRTGYIAGVSITADFGGQEFVSNYYPVQHENGENLDRDKVWRYLKNELGRDSQPKVGANMSYDMDFLKHEGIDVRGKVYDVLVAEPILDENKKPNEYDLDSVAERWTGKHKDSQALYQWLADNFGGQATRGVQAARIHKAPWHIVAPYAISDTELPLEIIDEQLVAIEKEDLTEIWELERDLFPMLMAMRDRGVHIDADRAKSAQDSMIEQVQELKQILYDNEVDANVARSIAAYCDLVDIKYGLTAKSKEPSFTQKWLEKHQHDNVLKAVLEIRRFDKNNGTFIQGLLKHMTGGNRVHCQFNQLRSDKYGTVSGRFSSSNPNLQNQPARDEEMGPLVRGLFIPDPDEDWGSADYSQIEYRLLVHYAYATFRGKKGSAEMLQRFLDDPKTDMHQAVADLCGISRRDGKAINFGMIYGLGVDALIASLGYPRSKCEQIIEAYHGSMPFAKKLYYEASNRAGSKGFIRTIGGRIRRFPNYEPVIPWKLQNEPTNPILREYMKEVGGNWVRDNSKRPKPLPHAEAKIEYPSVRLKRAHTHTALNALLQGGAADIMKRAMLDIWNAGICDHLGAPLLTVHDELNWSIPRTTAAREAFDESVRIMEAVYSDRLKIPLIVDNETGENWAQCK